MPLIVGAPRSGTTLLRLILDSHSSLAIPPETGFLAPISENPQRFSNPESLLDFITAPETSPGWPDFHLNEDQLRASITGIQPFDLANGVRRIYEQYSARFHKPRYGDKTPGYCFYMAGIEQLLPEASFIHIIRDGRAVAASLRPLWFSPGKDMASLARTWRLSIEAARSASSRVQRYMELRYEALLERPQIVLEEICEFLQLPFETSMLEYHRRSLSRISEHEGRKHPDGSFWLTKEQRFQQARRTTEPLNKSRMDAWRNDLSSDDVFQFELEAASLLQGLGYPLVHNRAA
ncbi:MAG: sulfotransferase [Pirellula sp.]